MSWSIRKEVAKIIVEHLPGVVLTREIKKNHRLITFSLASRAFNSAYLKHIEITDILCYIAWWIM